MILNVNSCKIKECFVKGWRRFMLNKFSRIFLISLCICLSALAQAPVQQIIADLARPVAIVYAGNTSGRVFNQTSSVVPLLPP